MHLANGFDGVQPERHCRQNTCTGNARHNGEYLQFPQLLKRKPCSGRRIAIVLGFSWALSAQLFGMDPGKGVVDGAWCARLRCEFTLA